MSQLDQTTQFLLGHERFNQPVKDLAQEIQVYFQSHTIEESYQTLMQHIVQVDPSLSLKLIMVLNMLHIQPLDLIQTFRDCLDKIKEQFQHCHQPARYHIQEFVSIPILCSRLGIPINLFQQ